jgi:hypothetical protein
LHVVGLPLLAVHAAADYAVLSLGNLIVDAPVMITLITCLHVHYVFNSK